LYEEGEGSVQKGKAVTDDAPKSMWVFPKKNWFNAGASNRRIIASGGKDVAYVRKDLSTFEAGIEAAILIVNNSCPDYEGGCSLQDQAARDLRDQIIEELNLFLEPSSPSQISKTVAALVAAYRNASKQMITSEDLEAGHRAGVRDVAVRLGLYSEFCEALKKDKT
jgi:hypothetical protein